MREKESTLKNENTSTIALILVLCLILGACFILLSKSIPEKSIYNPWASDMLSAIGSLIGVGTVLEMLKLLFNKKKTTIQRFITTLKKHRKENMLLEEMGCIGGQSNGMDSRELFEQAEPNDEIFWLDTQDTLIDDWSEQLSNAVKRGVKVKMLIMDSQSHALELRAREINEDIKTFQNDQISFNDKLKRLQKKLSSESGSLQIKIYLDLPCAPIFILKKAKHVFAWSSYFLSISSSKMPHLRWEATGEEENTHNRMALKLLEYFNKKWVEADKPWESEYFPTGYWVYFFELENSEKVFGKYSIYRMRDGLHAEGEAWYKSDIVKKDFSTKFRDYRRGMWRSTGAFEVTPNKGKYTIPYELLYQQKHKDDVSQSYYKSNFELHYDQDNTLDAKQLLDGKLYRLIRVKEGDEYKEKQVESNIKSLRIPQSEIELWKTNEWPKKIVSKFCELYPDLKLEIDKN